MLGSFSFILGWKIGNQSYLQGSKEKVCPRCVWSSTEQANDTVGKKRMEMELGATRSSGQNGVSQQNSGQ